MKSFVQTGDIVEVTAPATVASGDLVAVGDIVGVACTDAASGAKVNIQTAGVFNVNKTSAQAWASVGLTIYRDASTGLATTTAGTNPPIGINLAVAANPSATGLVRLNGVFGLPSAAQMAAGDA
jgi:predicted RecA/RadA family phage recombinase